MGILLKWNCKDENENNRNQWSPRLHYIKCLTLIRKRIIKLSVSQKKIETQQQWKENKIDNEFRKYRAKIYPSSLPSSNNNKKQLTEIFNLNGNTGKLQILSKKMEIWDNGLHRHTIAFDMKHKKKTQTNKQQTNSREMLKQQSILFLFISLHLTFFTYEIYLFPKKGIKCTSPEKKHIQ